MMKKIIFIGCLMLSLAKAQTKKEGCTLYPFDYNKSIGAGILKKKLIPTKVFYEKCPIENIYIDSLINYDTAKKIIHKLARNDDDMNLFQLLVYRYYSESNNKEIEKSIQNFYLISHSELLLDYALILYLVKPTAILKLMTKEKNEIYDNLNGSMNYYYKSLSQDVISTFKPVKVIKNEFIIYYPKSLDEYFKVDPSFIPYLDKTKKYLRLGAYVDAQIKRTDFYSKEEIELLRKIRSEVCKPF